jgi:Pyruvate/2-oxoacid:ferredoxin oxidoreductase delta subunit
MVWQWNLNSAQCGGCGICADVCPEAAIRMTRDMAYPQSLPGKCVGCMICPAQCPFEAIAIDALSAVR